MSEFYIGEKYVSYWHLTVYKVHLYICYVIEKSYLPVIPTSVSKSSVNAARVTGGAIAKIGKNNLENKLVSFSRPNRLFKLFRRVTVIIGNELDNVRTGNNARKYRRKSTGQTFTHFKYGPYCMVSLWEALNDLKVSG